jgi:hypothetical protein
MTQLAEDASRHETAHPLLPRYFRKHKYSYKAERKDGPCSHMPAK